MKKKTITTRKKRVSKKAKSKDSSARRVNARTWEVPDWREETLARIRMLIVEADPAVVEEVKWRKPSNAMKGVPVWSNHGIICTGETYKDKVKVTFARGAAFPDPAGLFNSSLDGNTRRAIDIRKDDQMDETALKALISAAVALNQSACGFARV